jgi:hypothetical protein
VTIADRTATGRGAALRFARACADIARVQPVPSFRWAAAGLVVEVPGAGTGLVRLPDESASSQAVSRPDSPEAPLAAAGAAAALVASALTASVGGGDPRWTCSVSTVLGPPGPRPRPDSEWLGYAPVSDGWIGLVLPGRDAQEIWSSAVSTLGVGQMPRLAAAALMQRLGVAAFPAHAPRAAEPPVMETFRPPVAPMLQPAGSVMMPAVSARRVVDLGRVVAAPFAAQILAGLGAHVRRVRPPDPAIAPEEAGDVIDLSDPTGAREIAALVGAADLVIENFRPRGWDIVQAAISRPPRRHAAIRGFDAGSPLRNWKMYGFLVEGFFGIGSRPCDRDGRAEGRAMWDRLCGVVAAAAAIQQLAHESAMAAVSEISQIGLARTWVSAQRPDSPNRDEEVPSR